MRNMGTIVQDTQLVRISNSVWSVSDNAYQHARRNSDAQNARIEHYAALRHLITSMVGGPTPSCTTPTPRTLASVPGSVTTSFATNSDYGRKPKVAEFCSNSANHLTRALSLWTNRNLDD